MAIQKKGRKKKRRLTKAELKTVREWFENAPAHKKPTIRQIARWAGINQPSVVKSLGGWKGIKRGKPIPPPKPPSQLDTQNIKQPLSIESAEFGEGGIIEPIKK